MNSICFYDFRYDHVGFTDEDWDEITRGDKMIIRDYYLNHRDITCTQLYSFYSKPDKVEKVERAYHLSYRPPLFIDINELWLN